MSFHIHFVRFISDARLLLKPPAAGKFVNINIYTADRHWLGRWQPQQCKRRPPPHLLLGPGDASLPVTDRTWLTAAISVAVSLVVRACVCVCICVRVNGWFCIWFHVILFSFLLWLLFPSRCRACCPNYAGCSRFTTFAYIVSRTANVPKKPSRL